MTAPVRIEAEAWGDLRFAALARACGLADLSHALITVAKIWSWQTEHYTPERPTYVVDGDLIDSVLGSGGATKMVRARLAEETPDGYRIRGSEGRVEWLWKLRTRGQKGSEQAAKRKKADKSLPGGSPTGRAQPSPLIPVPVPEDPILSREPLHPEPPAGSSAADPDQSRRQEIRREIWRELEAARGAVAAELGQAYQLITAFDPGERDLAMHLARTEDLAAAAAVARHAIAVAREEAITKRSLEWFSGVIFGDRQMRRAAGMDPAKMRAARTAIAPRRVQRLADRPDDDNPPIPAWQRESAGAKP